MGRPIPASRPPLPRAARGITVVEAVVALAMLGFVAAMALPHFVNLQRDTRIARLEAARGAVQSAAALMHGVALSRQGRDQLPCDGGGYGRNPPEIDAAGDGNVCTENGRVQLKALYPAATLAGIVAASGLAGVAGTPTASQLAVDGLRAEAGPAALTLQVAGAPDPSRCAFSYRAPAAVGAPPQVSAPETRGC